MGVDLTLLIVDGDSIPYAHTMLELERRSHFWPYVQELSSSEFERPLSSYHATVPDGSMEGEPCYGKTVETPYGEPLRWVRARDLLAIKQAALARFCEDSANAAAWAYLAALNPDTRVALYWH